MLGLWSPFYHHINDLDDDENSVADTDTRKDTEDDDARGRKRQRRSIFFTGPDTDSEDDDDGLALQHGRALSHLKSENVHLRLAVVPATPYPANPLCKGACALTPSFPRRSSSPCLDIASAFVAVHEEPNAGYRSYMEDRSAAMTADGVAYLGIYDGHGGVDASTFLQRHLLPTIQKHLQPGCDVHDALTAAYSATNAAFRATGSIQGSTATTIILKNHRLIAANVGDSPAFVVKKSGEVYSVIQEHKIEGEEAARIAAQGVPIYRSPTGPAYMGTPDGTRWLNMSRAFGDFVYPAISCQPHVCSLDVSDGRFLVMGSDGLTEKWPVAEAAQYLTQLASAGWSLPAICRSLVERSLQRGSTDNISCMVVDLEAYMLHAETAEPSAREAEASAGDADAAQPGQQRRRSSDSEAAEAEQRFSLQHDLNLLQQQEWQCVQDGEGWDWRTCAAGDMEVSAGPSGDIRLQQLLCDETPGDEPRVEATPSTSAVSSPSEHTAPAPEAADEVSAPAVVACPTSALVHASPQPGCQLTCAAQCGAAREQGSRQQGSCDADGAGPSSEFANCEQVAIAETQALGSGTSASDDAALTESSTGPGSGLEKVDATAEGIGEVGQLGER